MSRRLDDLSVSFKPLAIELIARCAEMGVPVMIVDTLRTPAEQDVALRNGFSWTKNSRHLPDVNGKANAIDIAPYDIYQLHGADKLQWNATDPVWQRIGLVGKRLGMSWGGEWAKRDMGHFEAQ